ncbi:RING-H2 finger protein atl70 [Asimina triloba]
MNATNATGGMLGGDNFGGFGYGIGVAIGVLLLVTTITLASYYCTRSTLTPPQRPHRQQQPPLDAFEAAYDQPAGAAADVEAGLDEATLLSYPKLLYSQAKLRKKDTTASCCSICLADYKDSDMLRLLPDCGHLFHIKCVDEWLRLHPTCPVCRTSPLPTPLSTPLAEVVPLATRRS